MPETDVSRMVTPRVVRHTYDEVAMGQVIHFIHAAVADGISVTANPNGFTTLSALARNLQLSNDLINKVCEHANNMNDVSIIDLGERKIFVVPKVKPGSETKFLLNRLLEVAGMEKCLFLNFTHYNFIQGKFPSAEIAVAMETLIAHYGVGKLYSVFFDIDSRHSKEFFELYDDIVLSFPRNFVLQGKGYNPA